MKLITVIYLIIAIPVTLLHGFVFQKIWHWFIFPLGMADITLPHALGISMVIGYLTHQIDIEQLMKERTKEEEIEKNINEIIFSVIKPLMYLLIGWIYLQFI